MGEFWTLLRVQLKARFGASTLKYNYRNNPKAFRNQLGMGLLIALCVIYVVGMYSLLVNYLFGAAKDLGAAQLLPTYVFFIASLVSLLFGVYFVFSALFFARDNQFLASLPVSPVKVFLAKLSFVYLWQLVLTAVFAVPALIIYGIGMAEGVLYWLKALLILILLPATPVLLSSLICMLLMQIVARTRHRDTIAIIGGAALVVLYLIGSQVLSGSSNGADLAGSLFGDNSALISTVTAVFPPAGWAGKALTLSGGEALTNLLYFARLSLGLLAFAAPVAGRIYYKGALAQSESVRKSKKLSQKALSASMNSPLHSIFFKEWKVLMRSPVYALNALFPIILGPVVIIMMTVGGSAYGTLGELIGGIATEYQTQAILILAAIMLFMGAAGQASSSSISREGKAFWLCKTLPVPYRTQALARILTGFSISSLASVATAFVAVVALSMPVMIALAAALLAISASVFLSSIGLMVDLARPKLIWQAENEAIKQNANVMLAMLLNIAVLVLLGFGCVMLLKTEIGETVVLLLAFAAALALSWGGFSFAMNRASAAFSRIE
ncbi:MAG: hypothetical protein FWD39_01880 [Clostridiales bacterium]|nr:hypothetical protein [Clostridiales bacterium]